jgi:hypothetical protein
MMMPFKTPAKLCLGDVSSVWRKGVDQAESSIRIVSPYVTAHACNVFKRKKVATLELYTRFEVELFASGASDLTTLKNLHTAGVAIYHVPSLHAKMLFVDNMLITVGSQNFTTMGRKNKEATVSRTGTGDSSIDWPMTEGWLGDCYRVSLDNIDKMFAVKKECQKIHREFIRACHRCTLSNPTRLLRKPEQIAAEMLRAMNPEPDYERLCYACIVDSAFWYRKGDLVESQRDADRIELDTRYGYVLRYKQSLFLVEKAVRSVRGIIHNHLSALKNGTLIDRRVFRREIEEVLSRCVIWKGRFYSKKMVHGCFEFGSHYIHIDSFVNTLIPDYLEIRLHDACFVPESIERDFEYWEDFL